MKIRIIKDLPRCEIGQEFEVYFKKNENTNEKAEWIVAKSGKPKRTTSTIYSLDEIEGYYEECIDMPILRNQDLMKWKD